MEQNERTEVRELIHDILSGWQARTDAREEMIQFSLNKIDTHLEKLNGKIAEHEKTLNQELPHTIANCPQQVNIELLKTNMISSKAVKNAIYSSVIASGALFTVLFILYQIFMK